MIEILCLDSNRARRQWVESFENELRLGGTSWVVTDVRSKLAVQRRLLSNGHSFTGSAFLSGKSVLRANEVWQEAARKIDPELQIISRELMLTAISGWLVERDEPWLKAPGAAKTAFAYIRQLLPILALEEGSNSLLEDWLSSEEPTRESSRARWRDWYRISCDLWKKLKEKKLCAGAWLPGWLIAHREALDGVLARNLIFDLGAELSHVEAELLLALAVKRQVRILRPAPEWESDYPECRLAADWIIKQAESRGVGCVVKNNTQQSSEATGGTGERIYRRLPSASAEVKESVAMVRTWLEAGVAPTSIAIVAPDLEAYWPVLSLHLEAEGIPSSKAVVSALHSFPDMMKWLARMRIRTGIPDPRDLEADVFGENQPAISYQGFREVFSRVYEASDISLSADLMRYFETEFNDRGQWKDDRVSRDQFVALAASLLRTGDDMGRAIRALKAVLEECPPDLEFQGSQWVKYFAEAMAKVEVNVIPAIVDGIWCVNLSSLEGIECTHIVAMGLHEGALRSQLGTALQTTDLRAIERDLGFVIDGEDRKRGEFEARWILMQPRDSTVLLFAETDISGTVQTPSWTWLAGAWAANKQTPEIEVPRQTRFDYLMKRSFDDIGSQEQRARLRFERGEAEPAKFGGGLVKKLSASSIDAVSRCPLQFALSRILALRDPGEIDLDADMSRQGSLQHKIFEHLGRKQWPSLTDPELLSVIEDSKVEIEKQDGKPLVRTPQAWSSLRRRMLRVSRGVLEFERAERAKHPELQTVGCEVSFEGEFPIEKGTTSIRGSIDRVDQDGKGRTIIIDYKNRAYHQNYSTWARNQYWQPLVYAYAFENGWTTPRLSGTLAGIFIFDVTKKSRGNGFRLSEGNFDLFEIVDEKKVRYMQSREDLNSSFEELKSRVSEVRRILDSGEFRPEPHKPEECERCQWVYACRAPHLELAT
jgi:ATP-dependent helicase/nuclease subunit B